MKAKVRFKVMGLLSKGGLANAAGEVVQELKFPAIMSGEGGLTTETELEGTIPLDADQITDITRKSWDGIGILVLMELDE